MFTADYFGQGESRIEKIEDIIENMGSQTRLYDSTTGIYIRILRNNNGTFALCEAGNSPKGILGNFYEDEYEFSSDRTFYELNEIIKETINKMNLSHEEVNEIIENGLLNMLFKKSPELSNIEGFTLVLNMERMDRQFEKEGIPYTDIPNKISELLGQDVISGKDREALETLSRLNENYMYKQVKQAQYEKYGKAMHSAQEISSDLHEIGRTESKENALKQIVDSADLNLSISEYGFDENGLMFGEYGMEQIESMYEAFKDDFDENGLPLPNEEYEYAGTQLAEIIYNYTRYLKDREKTEKKEIDENTK